jgi:hypothetical protein
VFFQIDETLTVIYTVALVLLTSACSLGLWSKAYKDTFLQNLGMSLTAIACTVEIAHLIRHGIPSRLMVGIVIGCAIYSLGTVIKHYQQLRKTSYNSGFKNDNIIGQ